MLTTDVMETTDYRAEVDTTCASEWAELLDHFQDANIYQTWSYGAVRWGERNLSHLLLRRGDEVVGMAQLRIMRFPLLRGGIAYLRWGPVCQLRGMEPNSEIFSQMTAALRGEYVTRRGLLLRVLPNVFTNTAAAGFLEASLAGSLRSRNQPTCAERTFIVDITPPLEEIRKRLDRKWRNHLNQAEKGSLKIIEGDGKAEYDAFLDIYRQMWQRKRFDEGVDVEEFGRVQELLPKSQRMRVLICLQGETPVAGIVCSAMGHTGIYLLGATSDHGLKAKGAYLLQWTMIKWLKENGIQYYDLGGIDPERNPGVYSFKRGFSGEDVTRLPALDLCESPLSLFSVRGAEMLRRGRDSVVRLKSEFTQRLLQPKTPAPTEPKTPAPTDPSTEAKPLT
jgi:hypothetical protein